MKQLIALGTVLLLMCSGCAQQKENPTPKKDEMGVEQQEYKVVKDDKDAAKGERTIHVVTTAISDPALRKLTEELQQKYKGGGSDLVHVYFHTQEDGEPVAQSYIAYTKESADKVGLEKANTYRMEANEK